MAGWNCPLMKSLEALSWGPPIGSRDQDGGTALRPPPLPHCTSCDFLGVLSSQGQYDHSLLLWPLRIVQAFFFGLATAFGQGSRKFQELYPSPDRTLVYTVIEESSPVSNINHLLVSLLGVRLTCPQRLSQPFCPHVFRPHIWTWVQEDISQQQ